MEFPEPKVQLPDGEIVTGRNLTREEFAAYMDRHHKEGMASGDRLQKEIRAGELALNLLDLLGLSREKIAGTLPNAAFFDVTEKLLENQLAIHADPGAIRSLKREKLLESDGVVSVGPGAPNRPSNPAQGQ